MATPLMARVTDLSTLLPLPTPCPAQGSQQLLALLCSLGAPPTASPASGCPSPESPAVWLPGLMAVANLTQMLFTMK